jgi:hypothetical protein
VKIPKGQHTQSKEKVKLEVMSFRSTALL